MKHWPLLILLFLAVLPGCYEMDMPLLEKGDRADIAYNFQCIAKFDGKKKSLSVKEENVGGWFSPDYKYNFDGDVVRLRKLDEGRYIAQFGDRPPYKLFWITAEKDYLSIGIANVANKNIEIEHLRSKNGVTVVTVNSERIRLEGENAKIMQFLREHKNDLVYTAIGCDRVKA